MNNLKKTVFLGLSGGVDSAVSAALLKKQGYQVVGVFMRTWHPDFLECNEEEERLDAMRVAAHLDIPFLTFDFEKIYKKEVADYMIAEYRAGRTPNPDVMCNKEVKFGAFLKKALAMGADFVATGHYAICREEKFSKNAQMLQRHLSSVLGAASSRDKLLTTPSYAPAEVLKTFLLRKGEDKSKDQSYFLWTLRQEQLDKILFPIGHLKKTEVRKLAKKFGLPVAEKKDSQGICFLGPVDLKEFLRHYIKPKKGKVVLAPQEAGNTKGEVIGHHDGAVFHTLGERHGFTITKKGPNDGPHYVVGKDINRNILIVSQERKVLSEGTDIFLLKNSSFSGRRPVKALHKAPFFLSLKNTNWIAEVPKENKKYTAQIRYHGEFLPCKIICGSRTSAGVIFNKPVMVASGQSIVLYDGDVCLGGGVVK